MGCAGWLKPPARRREAMTVTTSFQRQVLPAPSVCDAAPRGLYDATRGKGSCGVGFIADIKGRRSHKIVADALTILLNLEHRGAVGADPRAGDGAGILVQIPHKFFARKLSELGFTLPKPGEYAVGALFMPHESTRQKEVAKTY